MIYIYKKIINFAQYIFFFEYFFYKKNSFFKKYILLHLDKTYLTFYIYNKKVKLFIYLLKIKNINNKYIFILYLFVNNITNKAKSLFSLIDYFVIEIISKRDSNLCILFYFINYFIKNFNTIIFFQSFKNNNLKLKIRK